MGLDWISTHTQKIKIDIDLSRSDPDRTRCHPYSWLIHFVEKKWIQNALKVMLLGEGMWGLM